MPGTGLGSRIPTMVSVLIELTAQRETIIQQILEI